MDFEQLFTGEWGGWIIGFLTAAFAPIVVDKLNEIIKKPKISAAVLGANFIQSDPSGWSVRIAIRNDGGSDDTLVAAHMWEDRKKKKDYSIYAMHEVAAALDPWTFRDPELVPASSVKTARLRFRNMWTTAPDVIELLFISGKKVIIDVNGENLVNAIFQIKEDYKAMATTGAMMSDDRPIEDLQPHWFPARLS
jgi:hypothetical protein